MEQQTIWPDPVPCLPANPVQGIRRCEALAKNIECRWLGVAYCGIRAEDMGDALDELGLGELSWIIEDDLDAGDVAEAARALREALGGIGGRHDDAASAVRWLAGLLDRVREYGAGLSSRFAERLDTKERY